MSNTKRGVQILAIFMVAIMALSVFAVPASAQSFNAAGSDATNVAIDSTSADQTVTLDIQNLDGAADEEHSFIVDLSPLDDAGASNWGSVSASVQANTDIASSSANVVVVDGSPELRVYVQETNTPTSLTIDIDLSNIDTTGVASGEDLSYQADFDYSNDRRGDWNSFSVQDTTSLDFSTVSIKIGSTSYTSISAAMNAATNGDTIEVGPGTYTEEDIASGLTASDVTLVATEGADQTTIQLPSGAANPIIGLSASGQAGLTVDNFTLDINDQGQNAVDVGGVTDLDATFQNNVFTGTGSANDILFQVSGSAGAVTLDNNEFQGDGATVDTGIQVADAVDNSEFALTVENGSFADFDTAIDNFDDTGGFSGDVSIADNNFEANNVHVNDPGDNVDLAGTYVNNTFDQYVVTVDGYTNEVTEDDTVVTGNGHAIYGDLSAADTGDIDTADTSTIISAGDHTGNSLIGVSSNDVTITGAADAAPEDVNITVNKDPLIQLQGTTQTNVTDLTFEGIGTNTVLNTDGSTATDVKITNNRFTGIGGAGIVVDFDATTPTVVGAEISDNTFEATSDSGNAYTAVNVYDFGESASAVTAEIDNNTISGADNGGIIVQNLDQAGTAGNKITLNVTNNDVTVTSNTNSGIDLSGLTTNTAESVLVDGNTLQTEDPKATGIAVSVPTTEADVNVSANEITGFEEGTALDASGFNAAGLDVDDNTFRNNLVHVDDTSNNLDLDAVFEENGNTFDQYAITRDWGASGEITGVIAGNLDGASSLDTADSETIVSAGTHNITSAVTLNNGNVTIRGADDATTNDVYVEVENNFLTTGGSNVGLTLKGITYNVSANTVFTIGTGDNLDDLVVEDNVFQNVEDASGQVFDLTDGANQITNVTVTSNTFSASTNAGSNVIALDIDTLYASGGNDAAADVTDNEFDGMNSGVFHVADMNNVASESVNVTVTGNTINATHTGATVISIDGDTSAVGGDSLATISNNEITADGSDTDQKAVYVTDTNDNLGVEMSSNTIEGFDNSAAIGSAGVAIHIADSLTDVTIEDHTFADNYIHVAADESVNLNATLETSTFDSASYTEDLSQDPVEVRDRIASDLGGLDSTYVEGGEVRVVLDEGDHTNNNDFTTVSLSATSDVTFTAADGVAREDVVVNLATDLVSVDGNHDNLEISGLTVEVGGNNVVYDGAAIQLDTFVVEDTAFLNATSDIIALSNNAGTQVVNATISDNVFEADDKAAGDNNQGIAINEIRADRSGDTDSEITNNEFNGTSAGAIDISDVTDDDRVWSVDITNNDVALQADNGPGIRVADISAVTGTLTLNVSDNVVAAEADGHTDTGLVVSESSSATINVERNDVDGFDSGTGIDVSGVSYDFTFADNVLTNNDVQVNFDTAAFTHDLDDVVGANDLDVYVMSATGEDGETAAVDEVVTTIGAGITDAGQDEYVLVGPGEFEENALSTDSSGQTIKSVEGAAETTILNTGDDKKTFTLNNDGAVLDGFTINSTDETSSKADVLISTTETNIEVRNVVFDGPGGENRLGVNVDTTGANAPYIADNEISNYGVGVNVAEDAQANIVRNAITDNENGVQIADDGTSDVTIRFNDIVNNELGVENDDATATTAEANWWGDASGPSGDAFDGTGDEFANVDAAGQADPWLEHSYTEFDTDAYAVVPDSGNVFVDKNTRVFVAVLNDTLAGNVDGADTTLLTDLDVNDQDAETGSASAVDPLQYQVSSSTAGDYDITATNVGGVSVADGSATQTILANVAGVELTADREELSADGVENITLTAQLVDANGKEVGQSGAAINWQYLQGGDNVTVAAQDDQTDADGQAQLVLNSTDAGETVEVRIVTGDGDQNSTSFMTVAPTLNVDVDPAEVTANEETELTVNVTSDGDGPAYSQIHLVPEFGVYSCQYAHYLGCSDCGDSGSTPGNVYLYTFLCMEGSQ